MIPVSELRPVGGRQAIVAAADAAFTSRPSAASTVPPALAHMPEAAARLGLHSHRNPAFGLQAPTGPMIEPWQTPGSNQSVPLRNTHWVLTSYAGTTDPKSVWNKPITVTFTEDELTVKSYCNTIRGKFRQDGMSLATSDVSITEAGCPEPYGQPEQKLAQLFGTARTATMENGKLFIRAQGRTGWDVAVFTAAPMPTPVPCPNPLICGGR